MTEPTPSPSESAERPAGCLGKLFALAGVVVSVGWLLNFTMGADDLLPFVGNIDEALATTLLIYSLSRLGVNTSWLTRDKKRLTKRQH